MPWKAASSPIGSSSGAIPAPKRSRSCGERPVERGALLVELVDEDHPGDAQLLGEPPDVLGLDLDALDGADDEHGEVGDPQGGVHVADEVGVAGSVDEVDLVALPLERAPSTATATCSRLCSSGSKSMTVVPSSTRPSRLMAPARIQQRLGQRRLPRPAVSDEGDVADLLRWVRPSPLRPPCSAFGSRRLLGEPGRQPSWLRRRRLGGTLAPTRPGGEIGRRGGLKIRCPFGGVGVRVPPRAPGKPLWEGLSHGWSLVWGFRRVRVGRVRSWFRVQAAAIRCRWTLSRLWMVQTSRHSLDVASSPLLENRRNPRLALMFPKTVSTVVLRLA